jgi:hypothetical protein
MVERDLPARQVADELLFSIHRAWVETKQAAHGKSSVSSASFGVSHLFRPIEEERWSHEPVSGRKADLEPIEEELAREHPQAREVLEIRCHRDFFDLHSLFMIHQNLLPYGLHLYGVRGKFTVARIPSFTLIESALKYCLGDRALSPCFVEGEALPTTLNQLHLEGHHSVGLPLKKIRMHSRLVHPGEFPIHDLFHLIQASVHLPLWKQRAASAFFDVFYNLRMKYNVGWVASEDEVHLLLDLDLDNSDTQRLEHIIQRVLYNVQAAHGEDAAKRIITQYANVLKSLKGNKRFKNEPDFVGFKERLPALTARSH